VPIHLPRIPAPARAHLPNLQTDTQWTQRWQWVDALPALLVVRCPLGCRIDLPPMAARSVPSRGEPRCLAQLRVWFICQPLPPQIRKRWQLRFAAVSAARHKRIRRQARPSDETGAPSCCALCAAPWSCRRSNAAACERQMNGPRRGKLSLLVRLLGDLPKVVDDRLDLLLGEGVLEGWHRGPRHAVRNPIEDLAVGVERHVDGEVYRARL
jgi:hypothetical protein